MIRLPRLCFRGSLPLIRSGGQADVHAYGTGRVAKVFHDPRLAETELRVLRHSLQWPDTLLPLIEEITWEDGRRALVLPRAQTDVFDLIMTTTFTNTSQLFADGWTGLKYLWTNLSYAHCDVKPDNILWNGERFQLADFGCSLPLHVAAKMYSQIRVGVAYGTVHWQPDWSQLTYPDVDSRWMCISDAWGLSVCVLTAKIRRMPYNPTVQGWWGTLTQRIQEGGMFDDRSRFRAWCGPSRARHLYRRDSDLWFGVGAALQTRPCTPTPPTAARRRMERGGRNRSALHRRVVAGGGMGQAPLARVINHGGEHKVARSY